MLTYNAWISLLLSIFHETPLYTAMQFRLLKENMSWRQKAVHFVTFLLSVLIHLSSLLKVISLHWPKQILQPPHLDTQQTSKSNSLFLNILFWSCWHVLHFLGQSVSHFNKLHKKYWFVLAVFSELWILKWSILAFYKKIFISRQTV